MADQPDPAEELARLRDEIAELRHRIERLEDFVGMRQRAARPKMDEDEAAPDAGIEPGEPWNLGPPGGRGGVP
jgi:hypothetical protein